MAKNKEVLNEAGGLETKDNDTNAGNTLHPGSGVVGSEPRHEILKAIIDAAGGIELGDLSKFRDSLVMNKGSNQSKSTDHSAENKGSIVPHASDAVNKHVKEDIVAMFAGTDLNEEVLDKMVGMFENTISARLAVETLRLQEEHDTKLADEVKNVTEEMIGNIDKYLTYAKDNWMEQNKVAINESLKAEISKDFMKDLKDLFEQHYIKIPDEKVDVLKELADENKALEEKLNEEMKKNIELSKTLSEGKKAAVVEEVSVGLSELQKTKFHTLCESVEFGDDFKGKIEAFKVELTKVPASKTTGITANPDQSVTLEQLNEELKASANTKSEATKVTDPIMNAYIDAANKITPARN